MSRVRFIKYGKTVRNPMTTEHAEVSVELDRDGGDDAHAVMSKAKEFIEESLAVKKAAPLSATIGERLVGPQHFNGA